jgi:hypothetical protein
VTRQRRAQRTDQAQRFLGRRVRALRGFGEGRALPCLVKGAFEVDQALGRTETAPL